MIFWKRLGWFLGYIFVGLGLLFNLASLKRMHKKYRFDSESVDSETRFSTVYKFLKKYLFLKQIDIKTLGRTKIEDRPMLVIANHASNLDPIVLFKILYEQKTPRPIFVAKIELAASKISYVFDLLDVIYIDRDNLRQIYEVIEQETKTLNEKDSIVVFPEGTRNKGDASKFLEFKSSSLTPAYDAFTPILPIIIHNSQNLEKTSVWSKRDRTVYVKIMKLHQPINFVNIAKDKFCEKIQNEMQLEYNELLKEIKQDDKSSKK